MIRYDNRDLRFLLFSRTGAIIFSSYVLVPAVLSTILCVLILLAPEIRSHVIVTGSVVRIYAQVLGFVIVFRTSISFNRYFEGVSHIKAMLSKWRDAYASLSVFIETSLVFYEQSGSVEFVQELVTSKARLVHWFSLLFAIAMQRLAGEFQEDIHEGLLQTTETAMLGHRYSERRGEDNPLVMPATQPTLTPVHQVVSTEASASLSTMASIKGSSRSTLVSGKSGTSRSTLVSTMTTESRKRRESLSSMKTLYQGRASMTLKSPITLRERPPDDSDAFLLLGTVTPEETESLAACQDEVLCVLRWLLGEISGHAITGRICIAPPIISRVYQELSNGMLYFFMAMKIVLVPFPFPFAQFLQYALILFVILCPFAVLPGLEDIQDLTDDGHSITTLWPSLIANFFSCVGFVALNEIAVELEAPFGDDANDYPLNQEQRNLVWALEDCFFDTVPQDFVVTAMGPDAVKVIARYDAKVAEEIAAAKEKAAAAAAARCEASSQPADAATAAEKAAANATKAEAAAAKAVASAAAAESRRIASRTSRALSSISEENSEQVVSARPSEKQGGAANLDERRPSKVVNKVAAAMARAAAAQEGELPVTRRSTSKKATFSSFKDVNLQAAPDVEALVPTFDLLKDMVCQSVEVLQDLGKRRREDLYSLGDRLRELVPLSLPFHDGLDPPIRSEAFSSEGVPVWNTEDAVQRSPRSGETYGFPRVPQRKQQRVLLRQWMKEHTNLSVALNKLLLELKDAEGQRMSAEPPRSPSASPNTVPAGDARRIVSDADIHSSSKEVVVYF